MVLSHARRISHLFEITWKNHRPRLAACPRRQEQRLCATASAQTCLASDFARSSRSVASAIAAACQAAMGGPGGEQSPIDDELDPEISEVRSRAPTRSVSSARSPDHTEPRACDKLRFEPSARV